MTEILTATGASPSAMIPSAWIVQEVWEETAGTKSLRVEPATGETPPFSPGQFNMIAIPGVGEVAISVSSHGGARGGLVHTVRDVGAVSAAISRAEQGTWLGIRGPYGRGWPVGESEGRDIVIIAGGLGLAPLRPAIQHLLANRDRYGQVVVFYGARSPSEILYSDDLSQWAVSGDAEVRTTVDRDEPGWNGNVGVVTSILGRATFDPETSVAFICGPEIMMRFSTMELSAIGLTPDRIFMSLERNMHCGVGLCGHCQLGQYFICTDGPVFSYGEISDLLTVRRL